MILMLNNTILILFTSAIIMPSYVLEQTKKLRKPEFFYTKRFSTASLGQTIKHFPQLQHLSDMIFTILSPITIALYVQISIHLPHKLHSLLFIKYFQRIIKHSPILYQYFSANRRPISYAFFKSMGN